MAYVVLARGGTLYGKQSADFGETWSDRIFISDSTYSGTPERLAMNGDSSLHITRTYGVNGIQEVHYKRSVDWGLNWEEDVHISTFDEFHSFWPRIAAWGDSCVAIAWCDYKYSPYAFTGDIIVRRSFDNGDTWLEEQVLTSDHLALDCDIEASNDSIYIVYTDDVYGNREIMFTYSTDAGDTWSEPERVTNAVHVSDNPDIFISSGNLLLTWADARDDTINGAYMREIYFNKWDNMTGIEVQPEVPQRISLTAYPNPFNGTTTLSVSGLEGGEAVIDIYDICGRHVRRLCSFSQEGGEKKVIWDATDNSGRQVSSGIYFARVETPRECRAIKLLYLK